MDKLDKIDMLDFACEKYVEILQYAIKKGYTGDPINIVSFFLGLGIAQNVMYQKLVDMDCTVEEIERAKKKVDEISTEIIASVKGKVTVPPSKEKV
tara:strand:- start:476 stop:763 length:288 start_codon:yes stop_codon:yes gene_type:complete